MPAFFLFACAMYTMLFNCCTCITYKKMLVLTVSFIGSRNKNIFYNQSDAEDVHL